jgi:hypothetical protein
MAALKREVEFAREPNHARDVFHEGYAQQDSVGVAFGVSPTFEPWR